MQESMKERICELLISTNKQGMDKLIEHMEAIGFFTAPCSTQYHLSCEGGLAEHSLNVYNLMHDIFINSHHMESSSSLHTHNILISALLHDLGKAAYHGKDNYVPNFLASGKISTAKPFETNRDRLYISHEIVSIAIASKYIELTEEEEFAILYHNGLYAASGRDIQGKERPLQLLLHFADMWASRFIEVEV